MVPRLYVLLRGRISCSPPGKLEPNDRFLVQCDLRGRSVNSNYRVQSSSAPGESNLKVALSKNLRASAIPDTELLDNLGLYLTRQNLSRLLFMHDIYRRIIPVHGVVMEFGVRWGQLMSLWTNLRGIYEPYNYNRKVVGFDTFSGFPLKSISKLDKGGGINLAAGDYSVSQGWKSELEELLSFHESNAPIAHMKKSELVEGDISEHTPKISGFAPRNNHKSGLFRSRFVRSH